MSLEPVGEPDEARAADAQVAVDPIDEHDVLSLEVAIARASTQRILQVVTRYDAEALDARTASGIGTRRLVLARLAAHSDVGLALLDDREPPLDDGAMLTLPQDAFVARLAATLEAMVAALDEAASKPATYAAFVACSEQRAWLDLTHDELEATGVRATSGPRRRDHAPVG